MKTKARHIFLALISLLLSMNANAQESLTFLDWEVIAQDTLCPVYSEAVPLETDYRTNDYTVVLEYPAWDALNENETRLAHRYADQIEDTIRISHYISVSRGKGQLNISFVPIVRKSGNYLKLTSAKIVIRPKGHVSHSRSLVSERKRYADNSVLAKGVWKKIYITKDGMYRLTPRLLAEMGFKNPDNVHLYGYGGHQQSEVIDADRDFDDLEEVSMYKASDGSLLFWGNGLVHWDGVNRVFNAYATKAAYFLTEGDVREDMQTEAPYTGTVNQTVETCLGHALHEVDDYAWFRGGRNLVESTLFSGAHSRNYTFSGINSLGNERLTVVFTGNDVSTPLTIWANGQSVSTKTIPAPGNYMYYSEGKYANMDVSECNAGNQTWKITLATQGPFATDSRVQGRLDYIALNYTSPLETDNGWVLFGGGYSGTGPGTGSSSNVAAKYAGPTKFASVKSAASADLCVMRLPERGAPSVLMPAIKDGDAYSFSCADGTQYFVAFDPAYAFPEPDAGETVENQNLHALDSVDMLIIVPASGKLMSQAQRLADAHKQYSAMSCAVVRADHIYNEYSSGTPDATAYRRFLKMLYDRGIDSGTAPRYLLLMGDCAWDNRMKSTSWRTYSPNDYLLCYQSENSYSDTHSYCWEDYFGLMDDGEGGSPTRDVSDIGIGRFPVTSESQARIMVDKTIAHLQRTHAGEWSNTVVMLGDDGDNNTHMTDANRVADLIADAAPDLNVRKIMWDNYIRENQGLYNSYPEIRSLIAKQIQEGAMMFNYTGHGATYLMSHERVITLDDVRSWKSDRLPLWYVAACDITPFDSQEDNLGEAAVLNEGGAAVAFIGTTRTVYSTQNYHLNSFFSKYLFERGEDSRVNSVGDALRLAKGSMVSANNDGSQPQNKLQYALLGDPSLRFGLFREKVRLDSINGQLVNGEVKLSAGSRIRLSGHIEDADGSTDAGFNGKLFFRLYDNKALVTTRGNTGDKPFTYTDWNKEINRGETNVADGIFSTSIIIPKDINYSDENGRIVFYAISDDRASEANGSNEDFLVGGINQELEQDTLGPEMFVYLDSKDFVDGDVVSARPIFVAELYDESGIQNNGNGIGHDLQLCIDGDPQQTYNLNSFYTSTDGDFTRGNVCFAEFPELAPGAHALSFRVWDMMNNTSSRTLRFVVGENLVPEIVSLILESDVVSGHTNFHVGYNFPGLECSFTLEIFSTNGALQWRQQINASSGSGVVTIPWNGCNGDGAILNNGIYICRVTVSCDEGKKSQKEKKFIYRGNK